MPLPVLHIWPGEWGLLSIHPPCLVAALYLQLTIPGKFNIAHCTNPDSSPSGTLPFLTHNQQVVTSLSSILKYISGLEGNEYKAVNIDADLNAFETAQNAAWCSHVEAKLGDLTSYMLFSNPANWQKHTGLTLAYALPIPQRYYVPSRIRNMYRSRLEAAGLWPHESIESRRPLFPSSTGLRASSDDHKEQIAQTFQHEKIVQLARDSLDIYARLLGTKRLIYHEQLTTLDIMLAAHVLLIVKPPFPDKLLADLLNDSYPTLVSHAEHILSRSMQSPPSILPQRREKSEEETRYERVTWGWVALALGSIGLFLLSSHNPFALRSKGDREVVDETVN
ncbi:hypothetical protein R3P38DRAFT_3397759 [Favolaschia claudopus]|uniref:Mitochondrial outer membrane transport complex Sam37/metaxin N-terminal domain-containing protein n=1 Tax=Favolaschia claudopus TaxID=2862362 RepID=A0AAW0B4Y1_9AGAR